LDDRRRLEHPARKDETGEAGEVLDPLPRPCRLGQWNQASQAHAGLGKDRICRQVGVHAIDSLVNCKNGPRSVDSDPAGEDDRRRLGKPLVASAGLGHPSFAPYYIARPVSRQRDLRPPTHWPVTTGACSHARIRKTVGILIIPWTW